MSRLFRGVNLALFESAGGGLEPKSTAAFVRAPEWGVDEWGNSFWGENEKNAVVHHQRHQLGNPTSGISTTPHYERAVFYATTGGTERFGRVYVIDEALCASYGVALHVVNEIVPNPSVPEDDEVILVAADCGPIPREIVIEVCVVVSEVPNNS